MPALMGAAGSGPPLHSAAIRQQRFWHLCWEQGTAALCLSTVSLIRGVSSSICQQDLQLLNMLAFLLLWCSAPACHTLCPDNLQTYLHTAISLYISLQLYLMSELDCIIHSTYLNPDADLSNIPAHQFAPNIIHCLSLVGH